MTGIGMVEDRYYAKITLGQSVPGKQPCTVYSCACTSPYGAQREYNRLALYHLGLEDPRFLHGRLLNTSPMIVNVFSSNPA
jgi:hypothetical protein